MTPLHDEGSLLDYLAQALEPGRVLELEEELYASRGLRQQLHRLAEEPLDWVVRGHRLSARVRAGQEPEVEVQGLAAGSGQVALTTAVSGLPACRLRLVVARNARGEWDHDAWLLGVDGLHLPFSVWLDYAPEVGGVAASLPVDPVLGAFWSTARGPGEAPLLRARVVDTEGT